MALNPRQRAFADYYIETGNASESAVRAGYTPSYAKAQSYKLLENVGIKAYIEERMTELQSTRIADQTEILEFLTAVMRGEIDEPVTVLDGEGYQRVDYLKPSAGTRKAAAELLGKRYKLWTEKIEQTGQMVMIVDDMPLDDDE